MPFFLDKYVLNDLKCIVSLAICCCSYTYSWVIDPPLEITVPSKRSPWPDAPPEHPMVDKSVDAREQTVAVKHPAKNQSSRSKRNAQNKRKHEARTVETEVSERQTQQD